MDPTALLGEALDVSKFAGNEARRGLKGSQRKGAP